MADEILKIDANHKPVAGAVTDDSSQFIKMLRIDDTTKGLKVSIVGGGGSGTVTSISGGTGILLTPDPITTTGSVALSTALQPIASLAGNSLKVLRVNVGETAVEYATISTGLTVGTTTIASGTTTRILYDNAGVLGEYTITGSGTVVAMQTAPSFLTSITTPSVLASANDSGALGASGTAFADLFLASGGVINWLAGAATITHSANTLTFGGSAFTTLALGTTNITMTGSLGTTGARLTKGWFTDLEVTNAIAGSVTGNAATVSSSNEATDTTCFPLFITASGTQTLEPKNNTTLTFNSNTSVLGATIFNAGTGYQIGGAAASGKILVGNGTNYVASTPTFPNASATSGKIIKSDGTNWVASTETYAAPGTSGNVMTSDGTNWTSATPASSGWRAPRVMICTSFETAGRFTANSVNGTATFDATGCYLNTSASSTSYIKVRLRNSDNTTALVYSNSPSFGMSLQLETKNTTGSSFFGIGNVTVAGTGHTYTTKHIGFKILVVAGVASLYATQADGSTENASAALTTLVDNDFLDLSLQVNGSSSVDYYYSKNGAAWSSATNLTSNMPATSTADDTVIQGSASNNSTSAALIISMGAANYTR